MFAINIVLKIANTAAMSDIKCLPYWGPQCDVYLKWIFLREYKIDNRSLVPYD